MGRVTSDIIDKEIVPDECYTCNKRTDKLMKSINGNWYCYKCFCN